MPGFKKILIWSAFMVCFWGIPLGLIGFAYSHLLSQHQSVVMQNYETDLQQFYNELLPFSHAESFWCSYFTQKINTNTVRSKNPEESLGRALMAMQSKIDCNYIVYSVSKKTASASFSLKPIDDWNKTLSLAVKLHNRQDNAVTHAETLAAARTLGPQLNWAHFNKGTSLTGGFLVWADGSLEKPLFWSALIDDYLVFIFVDSAELESSNGVKDFLRDFRKSNGNKVRFAMVENGQLLLFEDVSDSEKKQVEQAYSIYSTEKRSSFFVKDFAVFPIFIKPGLEILGYVPRTEFDSRDFSHFAGSLLLIMLLFGVVIGRYSFNIIALGRKDHLSLRWKLRFLFFFANGLPLMVLFFIGTDYLQQKRDNLIKETLNRGIAYLQDFDEKIELEYARTLINKKKGEAILLERLSQEPISDEIIKDFAASIGPRIWKLSLVASKSHVIGTELGIIDDKKGKSPRKSDRRSDSARNQQEFLRKIGQFFLAKINGEKVSEKIATEIELLFESVTQRPLTYFIFELLANRGNIIQWGFGNNVHPAIFDTLYLEGSTSADYFLLCTFRRNNFQHAFLEKQLHQAGRNDLNMKLIAISNRRFSVPAEAYENQNLRDFSSTLSGYPSREPVIISYEGHEHLALGFSGRYINEYNLIGLCPLDLIDSAIDRQRRQLIVFALLSLMLTLLLSQLLTQGFMIPLQVITGGAKAIQAKDFAHRLPELGRDEFGSMGHIFNSVMVDLEELSVASAIQEQLLPQSPVAAGKFSVYGRSVAMAELGGDYFDFVEIDTDKFGALLGDVAGHGVGAALIMAMAKAGIIQSDHLLDQPKALLSRLHSLILASKTKKQRKVMTFQYVYADGATGRCVYSNAGGCFPFIIRENASAAEELDLPGAALGAFKKANYLEEELLFSDGDAMIFYTDGIVEARNSQGEEMGYDNLKKLLLRSWDRDAETYYNNIYSGYIQYLGSEDAQDDLTMVVLVFNENRTSEAKES